MLDYGGKGTHSQDVPTTFWGRIWTWLSGEVADTTTTVCDDLDLALVIEAEPALTLAIEAESAFTLRC